MIQWSETLLTDVPDPGEILAARSSFRPRARRRILVTVEWRTAPEPGTG